MSEKAKKDFLFSKIKDALFRVFFINKLIIFEINIENPKKIPPSKIDLSFKICKKNEIDLILKYEYNYNNRGKKYSKNRLDKGDRCVLAIYKRKIIGYAWIMKNKMELSIYNLIPISKKRVYIYKGFVLKKFRGKRILNAIDNYIIKLLNKEGKKFIVTTVGKNNKHSIKARERLGFKRIGKIIQIRFFGLKYDYISKKDLKYLQSL